MNIIKNTFSRLANRISDWIISISKTTDTVLYGTFDEYLPNGGLSPEIEMIVQAGATPPGYSTPGAAAMDFYSYLPDGPITIAPGEVKSVSMGVRIHIDHPGICLLLMPRSGLGSRGLVLGNTVGLFDSDYQGLVIAMLYNRSNETFTVQHGDRVVQGAFMPLVLPELRAVSEFSANSERGSNGFGSTGVSQVQGAA